MVAAPPERTVALLHKAAVATLMKEVIMEFASIARFVFLDSCKGAVAVV